MNAHRFGSVFGILMLSLGGCFAAHEQVEEGVSATSDLDVYMSTDLRPNIDFYDVDLIVESTESSSVVAYSRRSVADIDVSTRVEHVVVGSLMALPTPAEYRVTVRLLRADGSLLVQRSVIVSLPDTAPLHVLVAGSERVEV